MSSDHTAATRWNSSLIQSVIPHLILVPILWVAGSVAVLGGGYYVITHMVD